ncbi:Uncharacterised protein [Chryseobacterium nakagawai]|uniref:Lipoprotein n=1 Tax=Chryseobacterium nakagawai TaxID=1241982 RepID=A0AAD0YIK6_CHRNA|nr:hypothetical protein [Chryseobacterium nakagawai]AZA89740.1 hypothetical protein EG343_03410 [Chryseobacterium nakagawai]VEH21131.1 Uncharacterised protein [Chryseobacterium nakagawai]
MKIIYFTIIVFFFSCSKPIEDKCFIDKMNTEDVVIQVEDSQSYTLKQILAENPNYLEITNLTTYRDFKTDRTEFRLPIAEFGEKGKTTETGNTIFDEKFSDQFICFAKQNSGDTLYGLGMNGLGYWLLKIENNKPSVYFLGLSPNLYYFNKIQRNPIVEGDYLHIEGSLVKIDNPIDRGGYKNYSVIEDGKLFKIKLKDLIQDSDQDGYNDIFENSFGLNPHEKDTDGDGINDFEDKNPMFRSSDNKFTRLYNQLVSDTFVGAEKLDYEFQVYQTDCEYFHQINPPQKILFVPEDKKKQTYYTKVADIIEETISPIQKNKKNPNSFYIYKAGAFYKNDYSADYENGKWVLKVVGGYVI